MVPARTRRLRCCTTPSTSVTPPRTEAARPSAMPAMPSAPFIRGEPSRCRARDAIRVLGLVLAVVLHEDPVGVERAALHPTLHDRRPTDLEQIARLAPLVVDGHAGAVEDEAEGEDAGVGLGAVEGLDVALHAEAPTLRAARLLPDLVGVAEVERRAAEELEQQHGEARQHQRE